MTILVGFSPDKGGRASLDLAAQLARSGAREPLAVATVIAHPWGTPSMAKIDGEFAAWATSQGDLALSAAREHLARTSPDVSCTFHPVTGRSIPRALSEAAHRIGADLIVIGSSSEGRLGQVVMGSTAEHLLHSSSISIAVAPRGYRVPRGGTISRVTCSFSASKESVDLIKAAAAWTNRLGVPLRIATFGVRGRTMYPPAVGLHSEDLVLDQWVDQTKHAQAEAVRQAAAIGQPQVDILTAVGTGAEWPDALDDLDWDPGEMLVIGSSKSGVLAKVFLGSQAIKIIRSSPVPVLVVPNAHVAEQVLGVGPTPL